MGTETTNLTLTEKMLSIVEVIVGNIKNLIEQSENNISEVHYMLIKAYNNYQDLERDGNEHIYDFLETEDLAICVKNGLYADQIAQMVENKKKNNYNSFFFYGPNYSEPEQFQDFRSLSHILIESLDVIVPMVFKYPDLKGHKEIYDTFITPFMLELNF